MGCCQLGGVGGMWVFAKFQLDSIVVWILTRWHQLEQGVLGSNRGNYLLAGLLAWRFPKVVDDKYLLELLKRHDSIPECSPVCDLNWHSSIT